ncbi:MAG: tagaturonate reductase, partial [Bacteroidota bacterium]
MPSSVLPAQLSNQHLSTEEIQQLESWPLKVLQFGTGVLLRGLNDQIIDVANRNGVFQGRIALVASTGSGRSQLLKKQDHLFTNQIEGVKDQAVFREAKINLSLGQVLNARDEWEQVLALARVPSLRLVISNTTEVGVQYHADDLSAFPPETFPAKLTRFLWERFNFDPSLPLIVLPSELLIDNGDKLRDIVLRHATDHDLPVAFQSWIKEDCSFCNTLVDRIVTGYPNEEKAKDLLAELGYEDALLTVAEPYGLWAIEGDAGLDEALSFANRGWGAVRVESIRPFRERKLRILNGGHTIFVALSHLMGVKTVAEAMEDADLGPFLRGVMLDEVVPSLPADVDGGAEFAADVMSRFRNPFLHHQVINITLQYTSKMNLRNFANFERYGQKFGTCPPLMSLGLAAFILFCRPTKNGDKGWQGTWE